MKNMVISKDNLLGIVSVLTIFASLYLVENSLISAVGGLFAIGAMFLCALMWLVNCQKVKFDFITTIFLLIVFFVLMQVILYGRLNAVYSVMQMLGLLILFVVLSKTHIDLHKFDKHRKYLRFFYYAVIIVYFMAFISNKLELIHQFLSPTFLKILFPLSWFAIERNKRTTLVEIGIFVAFHYLLGERTAFICMLLVELFRLFLNRAKSRTSNVLFWSVSAVAVSFPFFYMWLYEQPFGQALNLFVREKTGEYFFSGRNRIWDLIIDEVASSRFLGLGFGNTFLLDRGITLSTHNLYLHLYLNGGLVLISLFVLFMYGIWREINVNPIRNKSTATGKAYILGLLLFLDFEVFLLANNIVISLFWWITLAFIVVKSKNAAENLETFYE